MAVRFFASVRKTEDCWLWIGKVNPGGYGEIQVNKKIVKAHRLSLELHSGKPVSDEMEVCHHCDTPSCVRPDHLFLGTHSDNMQDMVRKGRHIIPRCRGEEHGASKLSDADVRRIRADPRSQSTIAAAFGISQSLVSQVKRRKVWRHVQDTSRIAA